MAAETRGAGQGGGGQGGWRGADLVIETLCRAGTRYLFALSGNQIISLFDATIDRPIRLIHVRHEAAAVHMADAWGRLTGRPGVALVTAGPGFANTLSALYVARMAESPLVLLSGQASLGRLGQGAFQELDQVAMARPVVKASWMVSDASQLGQQVARAVRLALSWPPGPVHLVVPGDVLDSAVDWRAELIADTEQFEPPRAGLDQAAAAELLQAIGNARRPLVLCGPAMMRGPSRQAMAQLQEAAGVPVIGMESPRGVNDPSLGAFAQLLPEADLIVLLGKAADFSLGFVEPPTVGPQCQLLQIGPDDAAAKINDEQAPRPVRTLDADPMAAVGSLARAARPASSAANGWLQEVLAAINYRPAEWAGFRADADGALHPVQVCRAVHQYLAADPSAVFISDGGEFGQWAQACISAPHRLINGPSGAIGSAIPFALAARLAFPHSRIAALLGDGTFGFHATEFDTAVRYGLPFVAVVGNDAAWNAEYQLQLRRYGRMRAVGCRLLQTRYDKLVGALGGFGREITAAEQLGDALQQADGSGRPACLNVQIQRAAAPLIRRADF